MRDFFSDSMSMGRTQALRLLGLSYATTLLGVNLDRATSDSVRVFTIPVFALSAALLVPGIISYAKFQYMRRKWRDAFKDDNTLSAANFRPQSGPASIIRPGEVDDVVQFATTKIPRHLFYSTEHLDRFLEVRPDCVRCIHTDGSNPQRVTGYYIMLPISAECEGLILDGSLDAGVAMSPGLIDASGEPAAFYVGMVHGLPGNSRNEIVLCLYRHLQALIAEHGEIRVYGRHGHPSSGKLMTSMGFDRVHDRPRGETIEVAALPSATFEQDIEARIAEQALYS